MAKMKRAVPDASEIIEALRVGKGDAPELLVGLTELAAVLASPRKVPLATWLDWAEYLNEHLPPLVAAVARAEGR